MEIRAIIDKGPWDLINFQHHLDYGTLALPFLAFCILGSAVLASAEVFFVRVWRRDHGLA